MTNAIQNAIDALNSVHHHSADSIALARDAAAGLEGYLPKVCECTGNDRHIPTHCMNCGGKIKEVAIRTKIVEILPDMDKLPKWISGAMRSGQLLNVTLAKVKGLEDELAEARVLIQKTLDTLRGEEDATTLVAFRIIDLECFLNKQESEQ